MSTYAASTTIRPDGRTRVHVIRDTEGRTALSIEGGYGDTTTIRLDAGEVAQLIAALTDAHNQRASRPCEE
jgi:hypothetical protein